tara:strand:- start:668 stop:919 length:252 start_codon:yes stop_codon:yes gene_type:complete
MYSAINLILILIIILKKMDLFKTIIELNNKIELEKIATEKYNYDSDDDDEEIKFVLEVREKFVNKYNKRNNRQFKIDKFKDKK